MEMISLFAGIGGFDRAADMMGWNVIAQCEKDEYCQKILKYYWPTATLHEDITTTDFTVYRGQCDILTGGFPCQPYSKAGKRLGKNDERHLWPHKLRAVREIRPRWVVGENVRGIVSWSGGLVFEEIQADLEAEGYKVQPFILPAAGVNAPHTRERALFVAYSNDKRCKRWLHPEESKTTKRHTGTCHTRDLRNPWQNFPTQSPVRSGNDGLSSGLVRQAIRAAGNAVVPQLVYKIFKAIESYEQQHRQKTGDS